MPFAGSSSRSPASASRSSASSRANSPTPRQAERARALGERRAQRAEEARSWGICATSCGALGSRGGHHRATRSAHRMPWPPSSARPPAPSRPLTPRAPSAGAWTRHARGAREPRGGGAPPRRGGGGRRLERRGRGWRTPSRRSRASSGAGARADRRPRTLAQPGRRTLEAVDAHASRREVDGGAAEAHADRHAEAARQRRRTRAARGRRSREAHANRAREPSARTPSGASRRPPTSRPGERAEQAADRGGRSDRGRGPVRSARIEKDSGSAPRGCIEHERTVERRGETAGGYRGRPPDRREPCRRRCSAAPRWSAGEASGPRGRARRRDRAPRRARRGGRDCRRAAR